MVENIFFPANESFSLNHHTFHHLQEGRFIVFCPQLPYDSFSTVRVILVVLRVSPGIRERI